MNSNDSGSATEHQLENHYHALGVLHKLLDALEKTNSTISPELFASLKAIREEHNIDITAIIKRKLAMEDM